jgi:hypothetical protein
VEVLRLLCLRHLDPQEIEQAKHQDFPMNPVK